MRGRKRPFRAGDYLVQCDRTGMVRYASECVMTWDGLFVDRLSVGQEAQKHPQERLRPSRDEQRVPIARPMPEATFLEVGEVTAEDL